MENKQKLRRPIQRVVRLSEEKNSLVKRKIEESSFPDFQNFASHLLIQGEVHHVDYSGLSRLATEIHKIGISINQMACLTNQFHEISPEDIKDLIDKVRSLNVLAQSELNKLIKRKERS